MEFKDNFKVDRGKLGKKKVKCNIFLCTPINRELAIHQDIDYPEKTAVSDVVTGCKLFSLNINHELVELSTVETRLEAYIKHYTAEGIIQECKKFEVSDNLEK